MTEADIPLLHDWLQRPHVAAWWDAEEATMSLDEVRASYAPEVLARDNVKAYIAMLEGRAIGYAQAYVALGSGDGWWEDETDPGVRGIDQFLGHPDDLGKGLGTRLVTELLALLFRDPAVTRVQTDPSPSNLRAIRCYEKAGFRRVGRIDTPDGPAMYMLVDRDA